MPLSFSKLTSCGNHFIFFDDRSLSFPSHDTSLIRTLCHPALGIGADGIILLQNHHTADFAFRIYNADGSEAEMCGNGLRCLIQYLQLIGEKKNDYTIASKYRLHRCQYHPNQKITTQIGPATHLQWNLKIPLPNDASIILHHLNTGVPHAVIFQENLNEDHFLPLAPILRRHSSFGSNGTNVNYVKIINKDIHIRTFERGVEAETLACGTGAAACALAAAYLHDIASPITVITRSKETLTIIFDENEIFKDIYICGKAHHLFDGAIDLKKTSTLLISNLGY